MSRLLRAELILPVVIVAAAVMLGASEFMTTFTLTSGGEPQELLADRHGYAQLVLAVVAIAGVVYAVSTGLRAGAIAVGVFGIAAMLVFLVIDLPDAGRSGPLSDDPAVYFVDARADPQSGFWLEAFGSVVLGLAAVGFATQTPEQLRAPARLLGGRRATTARRAAATPRDEVVGPERSIESEAPERHLPRTSGDVNDRAAARERLARAHRERTGSSAGAAPAKRGLPSWLRRSGSDG